MVRIKHQRVAGCKAERVFVLLFGEHIIGGAQLLDNRIIESSAFLHFGGDQQALSFNLGHFWLDVSAAPNRQGICGDIAAIQTEHTGDSVPEGGFTVAPAAIGDNQGFHIDLANSSQTTDHLHIVNELLIATEDEIQAVEPILFTFVAGRN
ncbi:hypothetical protein SDC9_52654 [bioreactor metagenome]|uniref:Uncharacterized protein n=1 Tax=bioreactor metagenome TaxID=1076179 RepID=A0A644WR40_9ZZZZ